MKGTSTGSFHVEKINGRMWLVAPEGNTFFPRAPSVVTDTDTVGWRLFRSYDKVCVGSATACAGVTPQAEDSSPSDVLMSGRSYTLSNPGDTIYLGSGRFPIALTYFQMITLGSGGTLTWYYLSNSASL